MNAEQDTFAYKGYILLQWEDEEDDCRKIFHSVKLPTGERITLRWTPFQWITQEDFKSMIDLHLLFKVVQGTREGRCNWYREDFAELVAGERGKAWPVEKAGHPILRDGI